MIEFDGNFLDASCRGGYIQPIRFAVFTLFRLDE